ncbi:alpha/beta hydrolase [Modestobacter sp. Leaf380]|uniref:alpha/beta hydrolase n=1 Tax=Modestobacter sp. Leaf380 TaxID=1736356 RepID=UPI0006FFE2B2|nr:alpha/beta hydrolase [Modestobacter sp. Leaf380]KQS73192.1 alpha/beta hydrolase [Modestobacter sp. Leaf380]
MPPFHPDLADARRLPQVSLGPRSLRVVRTLGRLARPDGRVPVVPVSADVTVRLFRPAGPGPFPALLWVHGGGLVLGSAAMDDAFCRRVSEELGVLVAAVEYRLAPEHPYPVPLEDCWTALTWLVGRSDVDATRVAVGGASAGGNLAAGTALLARERGVDLAFQLLVYPMLDDRTTTRTDLDVSSVRVWSPGSNRFGWAAYLAGRADVPATAAPARAEDLAGLPPAWVGVGTNDLFHDEDVTYARRLRAAGVDVQLVEVPGAYHGFDAIQRSAPVSRDFTAAQVAALRAALIR